MALTQSALPEMDLTSATTKDLLAWRDRIVAQAAAHIDGGNLAEAVRVLSSLELATTDEKTLALTDPFLPRIAAGRKLVATVDPGRQPRLDEVVIVYGNYPLMFANVVVNNPIKRHVVDFWTFHHDEVESDRRWHGLDGIYIINADERQDRYDSVLRELASAGAPFDRITRVAAFKDESGQSRQVRGQIGCLRSHIDVLRRAVAADSNHVLVLEDDFCFTSDVEQHLTDLNAFFQRDYDYWICMIATSKYGAIVPKDDLVSLCFQRVTNTAGYMVSRKGLSQLLPVFERALIQLEATGDTATNSVDRCWRVLQSSEKFFVFRRKLGFQASSFSDIEGSISRYLD